MRLDVRHPFYAGRYWQRPTMHMDADSRLDVVKRMDRATLKRALRVPHLQKTVRLAIERRLRKLGAAS